MERELKAVIVGAGNIGNRHAEAMTHIAGIKLAGFYDISGEQSRKAASKYNLRSFHSLEDVLKDDSIDIIDICTPPAFHYDAAMEALHHGKNVIMEKPMVLDTSVLHQMEEFAESKNLKVAAISQHRFSQDALRLKRMFENTWLVKEIESISVTVQRSRNREYTRRDDSNWRSRKEITGGGVLLTIGIHYIDLACWIFGNEFEVMDCIVNAEPNEVESQFYGKVVLNGIPCEIKAQWGECENLKDTIEIKMKNSEIIFQGDYLVNNSSGEELDRYTLHARQLKDFVDSIVYNKRPYITPMDVKGSLDLIFGLYRKAKKQ
ncbi:MAG: Gfo/Idh/MocA family oxidoreductase [Clostridiaceae bacterium]|nr:Gfo/Idh/MocA family oxidoreductase [Clostridiaceae bacterium]